MCDSRRTGVMALTGWDDAQRDCLRVLELRPDNELGRFLLANAYTKTGKFREAIPHLEICRQQQPDSAETVELLANCHRSLGQTGEARGLLDDWLSSHSGNVDLFLIRAQIALDEGKSDEAVKYLRQAETQSPSHPKTHYLLAQALRTLQRLDESAVYEAKWRAYEELLRRRGEVEKLLANDSKNVPLLCEAGELSFRVGDDAAGLKWLNAALRLAPNHRPAHEALAEYYERKGNPQAAASHRMRARGTPDR